MSAAEYSIPGMEGKFRLVGDETGSGSCVLCSACLASAEGEAERCAFDPHPAPCLYALYNAGRSGVAVGLYMPGILVPVEASK